MPDRGPVAPEESKIKYTGPLRVPETTDQEMSDMIDQVREEHAHGVRYKMTEHMKGLSNLRDRDIGTTRKKIDLPEGGPGIPSGGRRLRRHLKN